MIQRFKNLIVFNKLSIDEQTLICRPMLEMEIARLLGAILASIYPLYLMANLVSASDSILKIRVLAKQENEMIEKAYQEH
ncbi:MAG: hypothetical protein V4507_15685 [Verrucomicrobiota bacterium]